MASRADQRTEPRFVCGAAVKGMSARGTVRGVCENISLGGMFVVGPTLPVGATVEWTVELPAPLGPVKVIGEVRFVRAASGIGVRFTRLSPDDITKLQRFIATAPPAPPSP
jgi:c-di-GMP-binding flagellar brake protein YcgR